jgi:RecA-family ATPase
MTDAASAVAFLKTLFHNVPGDIFLCSLPNEKGGKPGEISLRTRDQKQARRFIEKWDQIGRGLFFCIGTIRADATPTKRGSYRNKHNIWRLPALPIDIDFKGGATLINPQATAIGMLERSCLPPQIEIASGGGVHAYWKLEEPIAGSWPHAESMLRALIQRFHSDPAVSDVSRLMRLPGTTNSKYDPPRPVMMLKNNDSAVSWDKLTLLATEMPGETYYGGPPDGRMAAAATTLAPQQTAASNPFEAYSADAWKAPVDVEARLNAMRYQGEGDTGVHLTQLACTASLLNAGMPLDDAVALVFNATLRGAQPDWDMKREHETIHDMGATWLEKHPPETQGEVAGVSGQNVVSFPVRLNGGEHPSKDATQDRPEPKPAARLASFAVAALAGETLQERSFVVDQLVPTREVTLLYGDGGTGKSLLALMLGFAMQTRENWLGLPICGGPCLLYTAEEEKAELHRRLDAISKHHDMPLEELTDFVIISLAGEDATLAVPNPAQQLVAHPRLAMLEIEIDRLKPALVVIDTAADTFGGNENDRRQVGQYVRLLRGLALRHDTSILVCAQPSLAGLNSGSGTSGSTAWNNSARSRLYLDRLLDEAKTERDPDMRILRSMKANYAQKGFELQLRWQDGVFVPQLAPGASSLNHAAARDFADETFLKLLAIFARENRPVSSHVSSIYAPALFARDPRADGASRQRFVEAMGRLFAQGKIKVEESGPPSRRRSYLVLVP